MSLTLYRNGSVYSSADPLATAMLVDGDTVAWVGGEHAATSIADSSMTVVDLEGGLITPGFVDSHTHITETGISLGTLDLRMATSVGDVLDAVAAAAKMRQTGMILGFGWDESHWPEHRAPSGEELERAGSGAEVYLARIDVHSAAVSAGMATRLSLADLDGWDAHGGPITRAAHQRAREATRQLTDSQRADYARAALQEAARQGYVGLTEMSAPGVGSPADLALLAELSGAANGLPEVLPYWAQPVTTASEAREVLASLGTPVRGLAGDLNIDGSLGSHTAWLRAPYSDDANNSGASYLDAAAVGAHLAACSEAGIQAGFHVIGDAGMDAAIEGLQRAEQQVGISAIRAAGHRFEHAEMVDPQAIEALAHYSITVSGQPAFDALWGGADGLYSQRLGVERAATLNPFASLFAAGVPVAFGSDAPVTPWRPWASVRAALEHHQSQQRISARAAFIAHTRAGWRAARYANPMLGQLGPGTPASFAIWEVEELMVQVADERVQSWSTDPRARTPLLPALDTGSDPVCVGTVHEGECLFSREDS
ncbi:MAG: amidohydrolase family protein [Acidobacteria bacterium]|nr:amidohydrolase family protein [Acidobacteriota bacterium]